MELKNLELKNTSIESLLGNCIFTGQEQRDKYDENGQKLDGQFVQFVKVACANCGEVIEVEVQEELPKELATSIFKPVTFEGVDITIRGVGKMMTDRNTNRQSAYARINLSAVAKKCVLKKN